MALNRPPESVADLAGLPLGATDRAAYVRIHADTFRPETLVFLMREAVGTRDSILFERCANALVGDPRRDGRRAGGHCEGIIQAQAAHFGLRADPETLADFRSQCLLGMFEAVHAGSVQKPFWEERFGLAMKHLCIDVARKMVYRLNQLEWAKGGTEYTDQELDEGGESAGLEDEVWDRIVEEDLHAAIRKLPPQQARAAFLTWIERRSVGDDHPRAVARIMGISVQAVYALLRKAKLALAADPTLRKYLEGRQ